MSVDERLFGRLHRWLTARRRSRNEANELALAPLESQLRLLLRLLCSRDVRVSVGAGTSQLGERAALPDTLPIASSRGDTEQVLLLRVALAAAAEATGRCAEPTNDPALAATAMRLAMPSLLAWLDAEWPSASSLLTAAKRHAAALRLSANTAFLTTYGSLPTPAAPPAAANFAAPPVVPRDALPTGTEREQRGRRHAEVIQVQQRDDGGNPLAHVFEKVKTAEEHAGGNRAMDGSDELDAQLEALEELDLRHVVRTNQSAASVFRADIDLAAGAVETIPNASAASAAIEYDEWDERTCAYLPGWCAVREGRIDAPADRAITSTTIRSMLARNAALLRTLRGEFSRLARGRALQRRQTNGTDIDVDAVVDHHTTLLASQQGLGSTGDARLYVARRPAAREVATLVLLDRSLSSDSWVAGRRVLDVAREATLLLGEVLRDLQLPIAIATFCSHSRRDCRFDLVKNFAEEWHVAQQCLFGVHPDGYTRIGPAVRHAATLLAKQRAKHRLLFVVSDCKPVDYDHYEGRRGLGDVQQALREARRDGIRTLALAIDSRAGDHLPRMFGARGFRMVPSAGALTVALARLHERLLE